MRKENDQNLKSGSYKSNNFIYSEQKQAFKKERKMKVYKWVDIDESEKDWGKGCCVVKGKQREEGDHRSQQKIKFKKYKKGKKSC